MSAIGSAKSVKLGLASNPESSSAWVKTLIDPAHAREYGCRGIPDENQQPTLVLNGRDTTTYTSIGPSGSGSTKYRISNGSGGWSGATSVYDTQWTDMYIIQLATTRAHLVLYHGWASLTSGGPLSECLGYNYVSDLTDTTNANTRLVAQSATLSWVAQEINRAGYIEAGYLLPFVKDGASNTNYVSVTYDINNISNLVTYTGDVGDGVYIVSTFNDYDTYRQWKGLRQFKVRLTFGGVAFDATDLYDEYVNPMGYCGMRPYFIHYTAYHQASEPTDDLTWGVRVTTNQVVEKYAAYREGGADAALYDHASVEDMIVLYDAVDLIFPAEYNDWKKVWGWIKSNAAKLPTFAASVLRHFPQTRTLGNALGALVGDETTLSQAVAHLDRGYTMPGMGSVTMPGTNTGAGNKSGTPVLEPYTRQRNRRRRRRGRRSGR